MSGEFAEQNDKILNLEEIQVNDKVGKERDRVNQDWERHLNEARE